MSYGPAISCQLPLEMRAVPPKSRKQSRGKVEFGSFCYGLPREKVFRNHDRMLPACLLA